MKSQQKQGNNRNNSNNANKSHQMIFDMAKRIEEERSMADQADKILNAYRKVQNIKIPTSQKQPRSKNSTNPPKIPTSTYSNKVKETLKEMNANRSRQFAGLSTKKQNIDKNKKNTLQAYSKKSAAEHHLMSRATQKIFTLLCKKYQLLSINIFSELALNSNQQAQISQHFNYRIRIWKTRKIFEFWKQETMLAKIQKNRKIHENKQKQQKQLKLSKDFYNFVLMKKCLKGWKNQLKRVRRNRELEEIQKQRINLEKIREKQRKQALMREILDQNYQGEDNQNDVGKKNCQLQNKLNGFLSNLKKQVANKGRLNTIKQKTQQSQIRNRRNIQEIDENYEQQQEYNNKNNQLQQQDNKQVNNNPQQNQRQHLNPQPPQPIPQKKVPLTNQQLSLRRNQLAQKSKTRKQTLQKLKQQKQQKRKKQQQQRFQLQKQIEQQNKRQRKQQYKKYLQLKKQQEQWQEREIELNRLSVEFNRIRLLRFYGWNWWRKIGEINGLYGRNLESVIKRIVMRRKYQQFVNAIQVISQQKLEKLYEKADYHMKTKLKLRVIKKLKVWKQLQLEQKQQYSVRHQINTLKIYFAEWLKTRQILQLQNFQWQRPRLKKAQSLYNLNLLYKAFESLKQNKQTELQNKRIEQHKKKIQGVLQDIVEAEPTIDYTQFL